MIPIELYIPIFFYTLFVVSILVLLVTQRYFIVERENILYSNVLGYILIIFVTLYVGLRPITGHYFGDMGNYYRFFQELDAGRLVVFGGDVVFSKIMMFLLKAFTPESLFLVVAIIYIFPLFLFSKLYFNKFWFFSFFLFVATLSFWAYGTNGIRNGMATSVFVLGLCFYNKKYILYPILLLSYGIHSSLLIPIIAFVSSEVFYYLKKNKTFLFIWIISIPVSLISGNFWTYLFSFFTDEKGAQYLTGEGIDITMFSRSGFRWDFLLYSAIPVFFGYYYIYKKKFKDKFYIVVFNTYLIANAFWILIIQVPYSNRFAYLSWFLMAPVICYPYLKVKVWDKHNMVLGLISFGYYSLTFLFFIFR